jgi:multicomponent Na+:H+ antiporter subunit D
MGNWRAPFGITLVADLLSAIMVVLAGVSGFAVAIYSIGNLDEPRERFGYWPLFHTLLIGVCGAFLTGDVFNLYVWFEVMLMASFVLLALGDEPDQLRGAIKYVTMNLVASAIFLAAVGILYGVVGTLNMADLAVKLSNVSNPGTVTTLATLFLIAFGIKSAVFPLFFWLPASYHTPPVAVSAIFAGLLTKVGVYAMIRVFTLIFVHDKAYTHSLIIIIAGFTMVTGVLGAAAQYEIRRILSFHIISQIGYMVMGLGIAGLTTSPEVRILALAGSVFYITHHIIVKTNLFLISGIIQRLGGTLELKELGGLYRTQPALAMLFLVPAMSLAGMPPLSGFFAKLSLLQAGLRAEQYTIVAVSLAVGLLTLFSMTKIWAEAFWKVPPHGIDEAASLPRLSRRERVWLVAPCVLLAVITIAIGFGAEPVFRLARRAGEQLENRQLYIDAVGVAPR